MDDMISDTTVEKHGTHTIHLKTTGHENSKVTVCLAAATDGTKKKPLLCSKEENVRQTD